MTLQTRRRDEEEDGFSLIELLVSMAILAVLFTVVISATTTMFRDVRKQTGATDSTSQSRKVTTLFDKTVRYANFVTLPGSNAGGTATYVEWRTGVSMTSPQTCTQWRYTPATKKLEQRSWSTTAPVSVPTTFKLISGSVQAPTSGSVFKTTYVTSSGSVADGTATPPPTTVIPNHETLTLSFATVNGKPAGRQDTSITVSAINTETAQLPGAGICGEGGRP